MSMLSSHEQFRLKMVDAFAGVQKKEEEDYRVVRLRRGTAVDLR